VSGAWFDGPHGLSEVFMFDQPTGGMVEPIRACINRRGASTTTTTRKFIVEVRTADNVVLADAFVPDAAPAEHAAACQWLLDLCSAATGLSQAALIDFVDF
jgi:hypothetical protein